jgi:hypothetical protein
VHSGPHPVMVSGLAISPGRQLQMAFPPPLVLHVVPGPQGVGTQGLLGCLVVRLTRTWIGDKGGRNGIRLDSMDCLLNIGEKKKIDFFSLLETRHIMLRDLLTQKCAQKSPTLVLPTFFKT